ncbi:MAG: AbrB/MazE/SpoVT family DNA-binding domain-containing protein [Endozoicomonas sp.]
MISATITSKGQITLPAALREELNVVSGDRINFIRLEGGRFELVAASLDIRELRGMVQVDRVVSVEEMNEAIRKRVATGPEAEN